MTEDDRRDGLALDAYTATFGPFLPVFPPGLQLSLTLQGDVVQSAEVLRPPVHQAAGDAPLRRIARLLRLLGLPALAQRLLCAARAGPKAPRELRSEEHTSELQSLMRISYAVFCLKKKNTKQTKNIEVHQL